jgi:long-chain acyl-CoA synthetase
MSLIVMRPPAELPFEGEFVSRQEDSTTVKSRLGRTLPDLLEEARRERPQAHALNDCLDGLWRAMSTERLAQRAETAALGLRDAGLSTGERIALFMESDSSFCVVDFACLSAGLIDVPLYLTNSAEANGFILLHSGAVALAVSTPDQLEKMAPLVADCPAIELVIVVEPGAEDPPEAPANWPDRARLVSLESLEEAGRARLAADPAAAENLRAEIDPQQTATLVYTSGTTGEPKGVQLTHENLSSNAIDAFGWVDEIVPGHSQRALSFLPLSHAFGRTLSFGFLWNGNGIWFTEPANVGKHLREIKPTVFPSVPRMLERVWERILAKGRLLEGWRRRLFERAVSFDADRPRGFLRRIEFLVLDRLVFKRWRDALGGELTAVISGGAALRADITRAFLAAGIPVCQGYGMTEASPIVSTNRPRDNRAGTVGPPLPGVEVRVADDGELLVKGPNVMQGYYRNEEATAEVLGADGWLHTGDIGEIDAEGYLRITDRKKDLFKLSTGKYVSPAPIEQRLASDPLVEQAVILGNGRKFCATLLFPNLDAVRAWARRHSLGEGLSDEALLALPQVHGRFEQVVAGANDHLSEWERAKCFRLVLDLPTIENGLLTPTLKVRRGRVWDAHASLIDELYAEAEAAAASKIH